ALREAGPAAGAVRNPEVTVSAALSTTGPIRPGTDVRVDLSVAVPSGWHLQSSSPSLPGLIATRVSLDAGPASLAAADYPDGTLETIGFAGRPISVYTGTVVIPLRLSIAASASPGPLTIRGEVSHQACDDHACLPPARIPFQLSLTVAGPPARNTPETP